MSGKKDKALRKQAKRFLTPAIENTKQERMALRQERAKIIDSAMQNRDRILKLAKRDHAEILTFVKPRPRGIPAGMWRWLIRFVIDPEKVSRVETASKQTVKEIKP